VRRPASGLVTAVEPVMRACSGTWIAHGSGSGDREVVDRHDRVAVPPGEDEYLLRRIWLTPQEEQGYYYGFANEGLWPLCHVAHVRPVFRESDWEHYREVNQRFADAVVAEARSDDPVVLVQDYHFALLPAMVRAPAAARHHPDLLAHPLAEPGIVRHLPVAQRDPGRACWAAPSWASTRRFHCKNFLETVDRYLEARIEHEHSTISFAASRRWCRATRSRSSGRRRRPRTLAVAVADCRREVFAAAGPAQRRRIAVGVDRFDYTKGILERFTPSSGCWRSGPSGSAASPSCRSPRPRAPRWRSTRRSSSASSAWSTASTALRPARAE
jgi:trehalose-6-phosphate synthase